MRTQIPGRLAAYREDLPLLDETVHWQLLRQWSLSEVYRVSLPGGETRIIKWGGAEMAREAEIYASVLTPLGVRIPIQYAYARHSEGVVMVMQDVGPHNLELRPDRGYFLEAARELVRFRAKAAGELARADAATRARAADYVLSADHFLGLLDDLLQSELLRNHVVLAQAAEYLPEQLERLYRNVTPTLVHHDYHAKNLVIQDERIMPIDWSNAYIAPHLGDLHELIGEARSRGDVQESEVLEVFRDELNRLSGDNGNGNPKQENPDITDLSWQLRIGGLCWLIKSLRWLVYGGTTAIPGSEAWIPDLVGDMKLAMDLR